MHANEQLNQRIGDLLLRDWLAVATIIVERRAELERAETPEHEAQGISWDPRISEPERITTDVITLVRRLIETGRIDAIRSMNAMPYERASGEQNTKHPG